jgi:AraC-like DNA-binding protein
VIETDPERRLVKYFVDVEPSAGRRLLRAAGMPVGEAWETARPEEVATLFELLVREGLRGRSPEGRAPEGRARHGRLGARDGRGTGGARSARGGGGLVGGGEREGDEMDVGAEAGRYAGREICDLLLESLLAQAAVRRDERGSGGTPRSEADGAALATYLRAQRVIDARATGLRSLRELAGVCGVSAEHLCRVFRRFGSESPYRRLQRARMAAAAARLRDRGRGAVLVKEVAAEMGFADPYHFSRAFKRVMGVSPESFRDGGGDEPGTPRRA